MGYSADIVFEDNSYNYSRWSTSLALEDCLFNFAVGVITWFAGCLCGGVQILVLDTPLQDRISWWEPGMELVIVAVIRTFCF